MAPLVHALAKDPHFEAKVCVTAQHREMLDQVLKLFSIVPDYDLNIMKPGQGLTEITCRILEGLKPVLESFKPDVVLVHGDTTTTMAASLAAFYQRIPVGHVEAGLRTGDLSSPWPEEGNRTLTGHLATYHFAPTETSRQNLLRENIADSRITVTGNTVIDALFWVRVFSGSSIAPVGLQMSGRGFRCILWREKCLFSIIQALRIVAGAFVRTGGTDCRREIGRAHV